MRKNARITVAIALLAAVVLSTGLSGCNVSVKKEFGGELSLGETTEPTARPATATPAPKTATPTGVPPSPTPGAATAQTITQDIVMHSVSDDGTISAESTFTMTASIQVGVVDGINMTAETVPMPTGARPYSVADLPDIGDAVQSADDVVVQVNGWQTVDVDDEMQLVLVDVTVGNAGKERQLVATVPCMEIVSGDGHWYSAFWYAAYWAGTLDEAQATARLQDLHDQLLANDVTTDYAAALDPGQAARGTAVFPVPKSATELAFGFQSYYGATFLMFANEAVPTIFVPLGLEGQFPAIPDGVEPVEAGATYQVGDSFVVPERGVAFQVQSAWLRQESLGNMWELAPGEQFVVVHVIAPASGGVKPLDRLRELALVDGRGNAFELQEYASDWLTLRLGAFNQRGVLVFKGPRSATGLKLKFTPLDPATMASDSPEPLPGGVATVELGEVPVAPAVVVKGAKPGATQEPTPADTAYGMGDRVVIGDLAVTFNGYQYWAGPEDFQAEEGKVWFVTDVTVENVSGADAEVNPERFDFVDASGNVHNELWNAPSVWDDISGDVLSFGYLAPGGMLESKYLVMQLEDSVLPGMKLRYTADDGSETIWDMGIE